MVEAVPMVMQCPALRFMPASAAWNSSSVISPARSCSLIEMMLVPEPIACPRYTPRSCGPPETPMVGRSALAAPISSAGVVLSQPISRTTPSSGWARMFSSTSIAARLRNSIAVGRIVTSPSEVTGNSSGKPPASSTP